MDYIYSDGGRLESGRRSKNARDCVARAIAIAAEEPYAEVWDELKERQAQWLTTSRSQYARHIREVRGAKMSRAISPDHGVRKEVYEPYLRDLGWRWTPTMKIGSGTTVHLAADELPSGRLIVSTSRHMVAVIDGVVHDNHDPRREGKRAVYGYWTAPTTTNTNTIVRGSTA